MQAIKLNQIELLSAITNVVSEMYRAETLGSLPAIPRVFNSIIEATNNIIAEIEKGYIEAVPGMSVFDWFRCDDVGVSSAFMVYNSLPRAIKEKLPFSGIPEIIFGKAPDKCSPRNSDDLISIIKAYIACQNVQWNFQNIFDVEGITDLQKGIVHHIDYLVRVYQSDLTEEEKDNKLSIFMENPLGNDYFNEEVK